MPRASDLWWMKQDAKQAEQQDVPKALGWGSTGQLHAGKR